jgi:hypothetical protein
MRVIKESKEFHLPTNAKQRLLLMCWYSLTHQKSLDSHRVRCMNSLSILVELERLISKSLHKIDQDIARSADEALSILQSDYVVMDQYARHFHRLQPILAGLRAGPSQKDVFGRSKKLASYRELSLHDFWRGLQTEDERAHLFLSLGDFPYVEMRLRQFAGSTESPMKTLQFLERHEKHLRWHINRIWLLRCDIVHSAEYTVNPTLLCGNLEYYLKQLIGFALDAVSQSGIIEDLEELFARTEHSHNNLIDTLKRGQDAVLADILRNGPSL